MILLFEACAGPAPTPPEATAPSDLAAPVTAPEPVLPTPAPSPWPPPGWRLAGPVTPPVRGVPGWVELPSLARHRAMDAVAPQLPTIEGTFDDEGMFYTDGPTGSALPCAGAVRWLDTNGVRAYERLPEPREDLRLVALCDGRTPIAGMTGTLVADPCVAMLVRARTLEETPAACATDRDCVVTGRVSISGLLVATDTATAATLAELSKTYAAASCPPAACAQTAPGATPAARCEAATCVLRD